MSKSAAQSVNDKESARRRPPLRASLRAHMVCPVTAPPLHRCQESRRCNSRDLELILRDNAQAIQVDRGARTALLDSEIIELNRLIVEARTNGNTYYAAADKQRRKHNSISWLTTVIVALTSGGSTLFNFFVPQAVAESDGQYAFRIVLNILLIFAAILKGWQQTYKPEWKAMNYEMTADDFTNYAREWRLRLVQGIDDRRARVLLALNSAQHVLREIELSALPLSRSAVNGT